MLEQQELVAEHWAKAQPVQRYRHAQEQACKRRSRVFQKWWQTPPTGPNVAFCASPGMLAGSHALSVEGADY
jgi:hypothetical protein